ncbi:MAG TPA: signal peptidase II [Gemmatimonadales bacterium]|jgi:signal peptidase II
MPSAGDRLPRYSGAAAGILGLDLLTKAVIERSFDHGRVVPVVGEWLQLRLVYNPGAAFGLELGQHSRWIFLVIAVVAVMLLTRLAWTTAPGDRLRLLALGLVAGGATGNLVDRVRSPLGVVDFLDVGVGAARWPTFNVADVGVTLGAVALAVSFWLEDARRARAQSTSSAG